MSKFTTRLDEFWLNILAPGESDGISNGKGRNVADHPIPFSRRNILQDTGSITKSYSFTVVFQDNPPIVKGQDLENRFLPTYESRLPFIQVLDSGKSLIFVHPSEGVVDVKVGDWSETEGSTINYMEISLTLLREVDEIAARDEKFPVEENSSSFREATVAEENKLEQLAKGINDAQFKSQMAQYSNQLNALFADVDSLSNSIINTINYAEGLIGDTILSLNSTIDRMVQAQKDIETSPAVFINNLITQSRAVAATFEDLGGITTLNSIRTLAMATSRIAVDIAETYVQDDINGEEALKNIGIKTFDNKGLYIGSPARVVAMTINELESTSQNYRQLVDDVIQLDRNNRDLLDAARVIQTYVDENKLDREKIITVNTRKISIFNLLNQFRLSYQEADRNLALNPQIRNPNFMEGPVRLIIPNV